MDQHLTVREARQFTEKSESTIKRLIREITSTPNHEDRPSILPPADEVERRKRAGDVFVWKINRELLVKRFPKPSPVEEGTRHRETPAVRDTSADTIIQVLHDQLQSKDRQLQTLETQLDRKDEQIKSLNERMHETNFLMRELQARLAIAPPASGSSVNATVVEGEPKAKAKPTTAKHPVSSKRRSFFGRIFSKK